MFKRKGRKLEAQVPVGDLPFLGKVEEFPFSAAFGTSVVVAVKLLPLLKQLLCLPYNLGIRTKEIELPPPFQLLSTAGIYYFVISPIICNPHILLPILY